MKLNISLFFFNKGLGIISNIHHLKLVIILPIELTFNYPGHDYLVLGKIRPYKRMRDVGSGRGLKTVNFNLTFLPKA